MAWNGSGVFTRTYGSTGWVNDANSGILILATRHDTNDDDLATGINACLTRNNEAKPTANFAPAVDNAYSLGTSSMRWTTGYFGTSVVFQGGTYATTLTAAPTANRAIAFPDSAGTVALTSDPKSTLLAAVSFSGSATMNLVASGLSTTPYRTIFINFEALSLSGTNDILIQLADQTSGFLSSSYNSRAVMLTTGANSITTSATGFNITTLGAAETISGSVRLSCSPSSSLPGADKWFCEGNIYPTGASSVETVVGWTQLTIGTPRGLLDGLRLVSSGGVQTFDAGRVTVVGYT